MEAVKMPSTSQMKSQIRTASADMPKGGDEFMKLLQVKKDQLQPDKGETKQTEDKDVLKDTKDVPEGREDGPGEEEEGNVTSKDVPRQDALLQAAMEQTAAQMAGIVTDSGEKTLQAAESGETVKGMEVPAEMNTEPAQAAGEPSEAVLEPVRQPENTDTSGERKAGQGEERGFKEPVGDRGAKEAPQVQTGGIQTEKNPQDKAESQEKVTGQESLYGAASSRTESSQEAAAEKPQQIPLKTSESQLPQDLGKTLADRLPGAGRELIVELEPANLGKLTIRMVYEAGRAAVSIMASNPKTLELLNEKAAEIASILEEKTGEETIIYTQAPDKESQEENPDQGGNGRGYEGRQENRHETGQENRHEAESFAQQLRLGLV